MQQITAFSLGFMKINCLGKLMKFQYNKICIADQKQQQRTVKYWNQLPSLHQKSFNFSQLHCTHDHRRWKFECYFQLNPGHRADTGWMTWWGGIRKKVELSKQSGNCPLCPRVELLIFTQTSTSFPSHPPSTLLVQGTEHLQCLGSDPNCRYSDPKYRYSGFAHWTPPTSPVRRHAFRRDPSAVQNRATDT